ncbi:hypothetical protein [Helicobacter trogontum]|uniref:Uncharacterized protein n=1 Tax=Helicobacter trogontum TaxID=50960 RepID=A0A4U8S2P3_9HELI|nr:hypothetical protein [Helicobacter trogontum]TLD79876.1 hypothetical protein LS81_010010 [Helicobacter trogontum]
MAKNIQTHNADYKLTQKFLDYANCADASYAFLKYILYSILGILVIVLFNGCSFSFKSIDPQYYKFKKLCANVDSEVEVYNQDYFDIIKNSKNIKTNVEGCFYSEKLQQRICFRDFQVETHEEFEKGRLSKLSIKRYYDGINFITYTEYWYSYKNLKLQGDEAAGWHWETDDFLTCSYMDNFLYNPHKLKR